MAGPAGGRQAGPAAARSAGGRARSAPAAAAAAGGGGGGSAALVAAATPGPYVLAGIYTVSLVVDGKTMETKPLRVMADPEVVLTEVERKKLFDMAMEMHELQSRATEVATGVGSLNLRLPELTKEVGSDATCRRMSRPRWKRCRRTWRRWRRS